MSFKFSEQHIHEYRTDGATVFRGILPPSLISDLRRVTTRAHELARAEGGPMAQRLQPLSKYNLPLKPFEDYRDLPTLVDAIARVLSPAHRHGNFEWLGLLIEPAEEPGCTSWHRDARKFFTDEEWARFCSDWEFFNQINCAIYEDTCTWIVPGSHNRPDLESEMQVGETPDGAGLSREERERLYLGYCQSMPRAKRLNLDAGDLALYRATAWHLGNYIPYKKRVTLHDGTFTPKSLMWPQLLKALQQRHQTGVPLEGVPLRNGAWGDSLAKVSPGELVGA